MNWPAVAVGISACSLMLVLIGTAANIYFARKRSTIDDEAGLTMRIARSEAMEDVVRGIAATTCQASFQGRGPWVKELANEVWNDRLMMLMNQRTFVTSDALRPEMDGIKQSLANLTKSVRAIESNLATNLEAAAEKGAERALIRVRAEGLQ